MPSVDILTEGLPWTGDDLFEMANLYPRTTGLPMTVWVSPRGNARHDARIKVHRVHGDHMAPDNTSVLALRPAPRVIIGELSPADEAAACAWAAKNLDVLIAYWNGEIDTVQLAGGLERA